jgi:hypothetical protein
MLTSTVPIFLVSDVQASAARYRDCLGFNFNRIWGEPPVFVILWRDGVEIMLKQCPEGARPHGQVMDETWDAYARVRDIEELRRELSRRGAAIRRGRSA